ncbi:MAG TPA: hypothetical protein VM597_05065 [Gemmataceae bacterium]|nr:hypothetical protein [Gemmataceae bacterium]
MLTRTLRAMAVTAAAFCFTSAAVAQGGTVPGSGLAPVPMTQVAPMPAAQAAPPATALTTPTPAECLGQTDGPWTVVAPYVWVFGMQGELGAGRRTVSVDSSVGDTVDQLDKLKGAAQLHVETGYGKYGVLLDLTYLKIQPLDGLVTVESRATILELLGIYRVIDTGRQPGGVTLDMLGGVRWYRFTNSIQGNVFGLLSAERSSSWTDLVVGARVGLQVTENLGVFARGDLGGYGIGDSSDKAINWTIGAEYRCSECASLLGGWRSLQIDREAGSGRERSLIDATLSGPFLAFALRF